MGSDEPREDEGAEPKKHRPNETNEAISPGSGRRRSDPNPKIAPAPLQEPIQLERSGSEPIMATLLYHDRIFHPGGISLWELFNKFDLERSNSISVKDLQQALSAYNIPVENEEQTLVWMKAMDLDGDNILGFEEFANFMRYAWDLIHNENPTSPVKETDTIFLGGSCNPTTWRADVAIPLLEKNNVKYFNPQVENWTPDLMIQEQCAKKSAKVLLFVVDGITRGIASMVEIAELLTIGRKVVLVINNIKDGQKVDDAAITGREVKDLNRGRAYLADVADRHHVPVYHDVIHATFHAIKIIQGKEQDTHLMLRQRSSEFK